MNEISPLLSLTASDLMSREVTTLEANLPLKEAARQLMSANVRGAPVVDEEGRCVGVLSVSDLARWMAARTEPRAELPRTCNYQEHHRVPGGKLSVLCGLGEGSCSLQRSRELPDGRSAIVCSEPNCVPTDWQIVEMEARPEERVREQMTTAIVSVEPDARLPELARMMVDRGTHRLLVLDPDRKPVGVVSVDDLLQVLAHPHLPETAEAR